MNSVASKRSTTLKSKIPVPICKGNSSDLICKEQPSLSQTSSHKTSVQNYHKTITPVVKSSSQGVKHVTDKIHKETKICQKLPSLSEHTNKTSIKNSHLAQKRLKAKPCLQAEKNPSTVKTGQEIIKEKPQSMSQTLNKNKVNSRLKGEQKKINVLIDKSSNNSTCSQTSQKTADKVDSYSRQNKLLKSKYIYEKENREKSERSCFPDQEDIKFESNEDFRKMILREKGLSPGVCKPATGFKSSSVINFSTRPSAYQKFEVNPNPFQEAMQAIANLSAKRGNRKYSEMVLEKKIQSPFKPRNSLYTPGVNPKDQVMKILQDFRTKQKSAVKSCKKKVTFSSNIEEYTAKLDCTSELIRCKSTEGEDLCVPTTNEEYPSTAKLTQINEGSSENTPCSPKSNRTDTSNMKLENSTLSSTFQKSGEQVKKTSQIDFHGQTISSTINKNSDICTPVTKSAAVLRPYETKNLTVGCEESSFYSLKKTDPVSASTGFFGCNTKFTKETFSCQRDIPSTLLERYRIDRTDRRTSKTKLCTPRPISFSSKSGLLHDNCSPEFFDDKMSGTLSNLVPIYTPLVLKNIAKHASLSPDADLSPVKLKLDFTATENDTPRKENTVKKHAASVKNILTAQKKLDDLADEECCLLLLEAGIPVVCGRYIQNPVAVILTEGDDMHFVPIRF